jgi:NADH-quinone oxidoreductase subunit M
VLLHTPNGVTAALCLWISSALSLTGLAFAVRALESRFGRMSLNEFHGHYEQVPALAVLFLITGLASVGFPGTIGFVPMELLFSGSFEEGLGVSAAIAAAAMFNGIAIIRAYFALFTGRKQLNSISLGIRPLERVGVIMITLTVFLGVWLSPDVVRSRLNTAQQLLQTSQVIEQGSQGGEVAAVLDSDELLVAAAEGGE